MNGATIGWDESTPSDTELVGSVNTRFYSVKSAIRTGMADEHNFPSTTGSGFGYHLYGAARTYHGTQSQLSSDGTDSRMMVTSDTSNLFITSSATSSIFFGGGIGAISMMSSAGSSFPQRHQWVMDSGITLLTGVEISTITFAPSGYSGIPVVVVSCHANNANVGTLAVIRSISTVSFGVTAVVPPTYNAASSTTIQWMSIGSRAL